MVKKHLAVFDKTTALAILSGQKSIDTRFSKHKVAPFSQLSTGDIVYVKITGKEIIGQFKVKKVIYFQELEPSDIQKIYKTWGNQIKSSSVKAVAKFGTLIFIGESERFLTSPLKIDKKDRRGWVVLG